MQEFNYEEVIEEKIKEMEAESYSFPKRMGRADYLLAAAVAVACLLIIIWGAFI